ncbi:MAG: M3 family oligoendopeptidase [Chloroflexota bacterium]
MLPLTLPCNMHTDCKGRSLHLDAHENAQRQRYLAILGSQTVYYQEESVPLTALLPLLRETGRRQREKIWRLLAERRAADAVAINDLWEKLLAARSEQARQAGFPDYLSYRASEAVASPEDLRRFHYAIEEWVTPVVLRLHEERRQALGVKRLRPWDLDVDPGGLPPVPATAALVGPRGDVTAGPHELDWASDGDFPDPFDDGAAIAASLLDCAAFPMPTTMPVSLGLVAHRWGHRLVDAGQGTSAPAGLRELAGITAELLFVDRLTVSNDFSGLDINRSRRRLLESVLLRWPIAAMIDAFEQWAYANPDRAADSGLRTAQWRGLWLRFLPGVDWTDLEDTLQHEWQQYHPFVLSPLNAIIPALAQIGASHLWAQAREHPAATMARIRTAAEPGMFVSLRDRYRALDLSFDFDEHALREAVEQIETRLEQFPMG